MDIKMKVDGEGGLYLLSDGMDNRHFSDVHMILPDQNGLTFDKIMNALKPGDEIRLVVPEDIMGRIPPEEDSREQIMDICSTASSHRRADNDGDSELEDFDEEIESC